MVELYSNLALNRSMAAMNKIDVSTGEQYAARLARVMDCMRLRQPDLHSPSVLNVSFGRSIEAMGYRQLDWPGHGVGPDQPFQYRDREYMSADEYDDFLFDPTGFFLQKYLPRVCEAWESIEGLASLTAALERLRQAGCARWDSRLRSAPSRWPRTMRSRTSAAARPA